MENMFESTAMHRKSQAMTGGWRLQATVVRKSGPVRRNILDLARSSKQQQGEECGELRLPQEMGKMQLLDGPKSHQIDNPQPLEPRPETGTAHSSNRAPSHINLHPSKEQIKRATLRERAFILSQDNSCEMEASGFLDEHPMEC